MSLNHLYALDKYIDFYGDSFKYDIRGNVLVLLLEKRAERGPMVCHIADLESLCLSGMNC